MERTAPDHVRDYCVKAGGDRAYATLVRDYEDEYCFVHKVKCSCGSEQFHVFLDEHPTAVFVCLDCGHKITVYDLQHYPCATKLPREYELKQYVSMPSAGSSSARKSPAETACEEVGRIETGHTVFQGYVVYEYSDEFETEDDVAFDPDDISWCHVFVKDAETGELLEVINDETA